MAITVLDPVAQTFIIDKDTYPNGVFLSSIRLFFRNKPSSNIPVQVSIVSTLNGYPTGKALDYSQVSLLPAEVKVSEGPQYLDSTTYTDFKFSVPVYINADTLYAIIIQSNTSGYKLWTARQDDFPLATSVKELPTSPLPTTLTKISKSPYIGSFFESQNGITYTADQTKDLMFVINRCKFVTGTSSLSFVVPSGLQKTKQIEQTFEKATANVTYDEINISTTDFIPSGTSIDYSFSTTLNSDGSSVGPYTVYPGKFGTPLPENIRLTDNRGRRVLVANSNTSFTVGVDMTTLDDKISPILSDDGLRLYTVKYSINNLELSNSVISIVDSGSGYLANANGVITSPDIVVSAPNEVTGQQAFVSANVTLGQITSINVTTPGSGYSKTPIITVAAANTTPADILVNGETSQFGGNALARYQTYPVTLAQGNDSGDLRVFLTGYRPIGTEIFVYYKILAREDVQSFEQSDWQLMTMTGSSNKFSRTRDDLYEFEFAPGENGFESNQVFYTSKESLVQYNSFYKYAIKIVLATNDTTFAPYLKNMRTLALPPGTGL
jgi:hypothetical protein